MLSLVDGAVAAGVLTPAELQLIESEESKPSPATHAILTKLKAGECM